MIQQHNEQKMKQEELPERTTEEKRKVKHSPLPPHILLPSYRLLQNNEDLRQLLLKKKER